MKSIAITHSDNRFLLVGEIDCFNVMGLYHKSLNYLHGARGIIIDFAGVKSSDSSSIALMLEWMKYANGRQVEISFDHLSPKLISLITLCGLQNIIPIGR